MKIPVPMALLLTISTMCVVSACSDSTAKLESQTPPANQTPVQPDNSGVNTRDVNGDKPTAADQSEAPADRDMTQRIRQAVVADSSLSIVAQNVKIITIAGQVTLRGPVNSEDEKMAIDKAARTIAGPTKVDNQLEVKR